MPGISVGVRDNNLFSPRTATVGVGGTVTWVWQGTAYHDIFSRDFPSDPGGVKQTGSYSFTFTRPGTYNYTCEVHDSAGMRGTIIVQ